MNNPAIFTFFFVVFRIGAIILIFVILKSCAQWTPDKETVVARVGDIFLYNSDLNKEFEKFKSKSDSLLKTRNFIDSWAKNQLLVQLAAKNLNNDKLKNLENLITRYRYELYSNNYIQSVVNNLLDTLIKNQEIDSFLLSNRGVFNLNTPLYQVRFIHLPPNNVDQKEIQRSFQRFSKEDRFYLDSLSFQYNNYLLKDSIWLNKRDLISEVEFLNNKNVEKYLKKSQFFRVEDSLGLYLFYINKLLKKGESAPRIVLKSTIKNIIRNQRKLKFIKQFEKDIIQDAIKSKTYEIY